MRFTEIKTSVTRRPIALHRPDPTVHRRPPQDLPVRAPRPVAAIRVSTRVPRAYPEPIRWSATKFPSPSPLACLSMCHPNRWYLRIPPDRIPSNLCCVCARGPLLRPASVAFLLSTNGVTASIVTPVITTRVANVGSTSNGPLSGQTSVSTGISA